MRKAVSMMFGAVLLLAGCESAPESVGVAAGTGVTPGSIEDFVVNVGDTVHFDTDRYNIDGTAQATLLRQAAWLQQYPDVNVQIEGNADERGTREYNLALGARRANSVKSFLVSQGVQAIRITTISYGKERPIDPASNPTAWAKNRRAKTAIQ